MAFLILLCDLSSPIHCFA